MAELLETIEYQGTPKTQTAPYDAAEHNADDDTEIQDKTNAAITRLNNIVGTGTYKIFKASFNQSGTSAPTFTVISNTLGYSPTIGYGGLGQVAFLMQGITAPKVEVLCDGKTYSAKFLVTSYYISSQTITFKTYDLLNTPGVANDMLKDTIIEIRVYD